MLRTDHRPSFAADPAFRHERPERPGGSPEDDSATLVLRPRGVGVVRRNHHVAGILYNSGPSEGFCRAWRRKSPRLLNLGEQLSNSGLAPARRRQFCLTRSIQQRTCRSIFPVACLLIQRQKFRHYFVIWQYTLIEGDFTNVIRLPPEVRRLPRLGFFLGSTIGNFLVPDAVNLLRSMASTLGGASMLLIGVDRIKDESILLPAYDDAAGVTALFNRNVLHRINRELGGSIPVDAFRHLARWNDNEARIEMHLKAERDVDFQVDGHFFGMAEGETIHTENSFKYGLRDVGVLLRAGGWSPMMMWTDQEELFTVILAQETSALSGAVDQRNWSVADRSIPPAAG